MSFWLIVRILALIALIGFLTVGIVFAFNPKIFPGESVSRQATLWHSLAIAFMATVSVIALLVAWKPYKYWEMLLPPLAGKLVSAISSISWYHVYPGFKALKTNAVIDGGIGVIALILYVEAYRITRSGGPSRG